MNLIQPVNVIHVILADISMLDTFQIDNIDSFGWPTNPTHHEMPTSSWSSSKGLSGVSNVGLTSSLSPTLDFINSYNLGMYPTATVGMSATSFLGMSSSQSVGMSAAHNQGMSSGQTVGMSATQNQGMHSSQTVGMWATYDQVMSTCQTVGMSAATSDLGMSPSPALSMSATSDLGMSSSSPALGLSETLSPSQACCMSSTSDLGTSPSPTLEVLPSPLDGGPSEILCGNSLKTGNNWYELINWHFYFFFL